MIFPERFRLKDKIAVVTGGAGLIGTAICGALSEAEAKVYIADIDRKRGEKLDKKLRSSGLKTAYVKTDISSEASIRSVVSGIVRKEGRVDIWINGAYPRTPDWSDRFEDVRASSVRKNLDMHMNGYFLCCKHVLKQMKKRRKGVLINIGSHYGVLGPDFSVYKGTRMTMPAAYSLIKGGIVNFSRYLATYYAPYNIRVNAVCPGGVFNNQPPSFVRNYVKGVPLKRMARPEEIASAVLFFSSDASSYMTGQVVMVDGGLSAW